MLHPGIDPKYISLMEQCLQIDPDYRSSVEDCINNKLFDDIRDKAYLDIEADTKIKVHVDKLIVS
jgi:hypothetical protein